MSPVNLLPTEIEDDLRTTVRAVLRDRCDPASVSGMYDGGPGPSDLWKTLATELGLTGLLVPEDRGGGGATAREAAVVMAELGRSVAPVPFLTSAVLATTLLVEAESDLVFRLASGEHTAAIVVPLTTAPGSALPAVDAVDGKLTGEVRGVAGVIGADLLLVPVATTDGVDAYAVRSSEAGVTPVVSLDMSRQVADVVFDGAGGELVVGGSQGRTALHTALVTGAALLAAEQVGVAQWCLQATITYLTQRRQFGRTVGGFQALKHRLADLYVEVEGAGAAAAYAVATLADGDPDAEIAAAVAQAHCSDVAVHAAEEALQLHGGIGMTWEHPLHLYLKRAKADQIALGTAEAHRIRLADLVDLPGPR
ncbi:MAG: acyl-CoA/acyl-ACP dehydrogenase [Actinomycetia bacterium]|nr:acyl-CoA/acyl-ACP dehydrogenase [Actinomycetes bacterium]